MSWQYNSSYLDRSGSFQAWMVATIHQPYCTELFKETEIPEVLATVESNMGNLTVYENEILHRPRQALGLHSSVAKSEECVTGGFTGISRQTVHATKDSKRSKLDGYYARIRYNGIPVTIPGCRISGNHLEGNQSFCTLERFRSIVEKFTPLNWKQDCRRNLDKSVFPAEYEPAGYWIINCLLVSAPRSILLLERLLILPVADLV